MERTYEIKENLAVLPPIRPKDTMHLEVNVISWYGADAKIDIRRWSEDGAKMTKGITLTKDEFQQIINEVGGKVDGIDIR
ncbi:MAG: PC4/YdbC family ssDNA-binding protein [Lachnospiraceae bacterium]